MELPKRLREHDYEWSPQDAKALGAEAADAIERLREALQYYADKKEDDWKSGDDGVVARSALQQKDSE